MRFLNHKLGFERKHLKLKKNCRLFKLSRRVILFLTIAYLSACLFLYLRQDYIIYQANDRIAQSSPSDPDF
ncbi:MAG: hypothetical protein AAGE96_19580 [Cyanobacteria bacterium P01_G01_bin.19]